MVSYRNFSTECPDRDSNGFPVCDDAKGFHVAANSSATMQFDFHGRCPLLDRGYMLIPVTGTAIYVYGSTGAGIVYTWSLNYGTKTTGRPNGNLLIAAENLTLDGLRAVFTLEIVLEYTPGSRFQFSKADVVVGTGMTG
jgi:hypothetical protein